MELTIDADVLRKAADKVKPAVGRGSTLPILSCLLLQAETGLVRLTGTDLDLGITTTVEAEVEKSGGVAVASSRLLPALALMSGAVSLAVDGKQVLTITNGARVMKLAGLPAEEFPALPESDEGAEIDTEEGVLSQALREIVGHCSKEEARGVVVGMYLAIHDEGLRLVATNGRLLSMRCIGGIEGAKVETVLPSRAAGMIADLGKKEAVKVRIGERTVSASGSDWQLASRVIEGSYPDWRRVVPAAGKVTVEWEKAQLLAALAFAGVVLGDKSTAVKIEATKSGVTICGTGADVGEARAVLRDAKADGALTAAFDVNYLRMIVEANREEKQTLNMDDAMSGGLVGNEHGLSVLMPMRIS